MARSKHTRPQDIIAARRVRLPQESRGSGDLSAAKRVGILLKELGIAAEEVSDQAGGKDDNELPQPVLPRVIVQKPRSGYHHPASKKDVQQLLAFLGERAYYGLREIRLAQLPNSVSAGGMLLGRLFIPGKIVLYEQPVPPWFVPGKLAEEDRRLLMRGGASIEQSDDGMRCAINWSEESLRNFMLFDVLMHEVGHHLVQRFKGKRPAQVMRTRDHEHAAELFAAKCRDIYFAVNAEDTGIGEDAGIGEGTAIADGAGIGEGTAIADGMCDADE